MRLKPKHLGDELTLDEYNAVQQLLYDMTFSSMIYLDPANTVNKTWASYTYQEHTKLAYGKYDSFEITNDLSSSEQYITIKLSDEVNSKSNYTCKIYYLLSGTLNDVELLATDGTDVTNQLKIASLKEERDYLHCNVTCTKKTDTNGNTYLQIPLTGVDDEGKTVTINKKNTLISRNIKLDIHFNTEPYIDTLNGKANQADEILIGKISKLEKLIQYNPTDDEKIIYRLDANNTYTPSNTMIIKDGMNIEIRGGTNGGVVINDTSSRVNITGGTCGRLFIIEPGGKLVLQDVQLTNADSTNVLYKTGLGGAILVEKDDEGFGQFEANNIIIKDCKAKSGGAIYAEQSGVYLDTCRFTNCTSTTNGGAIIYISEEIILTLNDIKGKRGEKITFKVIVKEEDGENVNTGSVHFLLGTTEIGDAPVTDGIGTLQYSIPSNLTFSEQTITAIYDGGESNETAYTQASLFVEDPTILTFTMNDVTVTEVGTVVTLTVSSVDQNNNTNTSGTGVFTIDGTDYSATVKDGKYTVEYPIPEINYKSEYNVTFKVTDMLCTPVTAKIKVVQSNVFGVFVNSATINTSLVNTWINSGVTDVYVRCNDYSDSTSNATLLSVIDKTKDKDIRIHAAVNCFYDVKNLKFITPSDTRVSWLKENITNMINGSNIDGVVLDYMRYPGTTANESYHTTITKYFKELNEHIKGLNKNIIISGCVMPETTGNSLYYGQNYKEIAQYMDYMMPMVYKGNYNKDNAWVKEVITYIVEQTGNTEKVVPTLQTYTSDTKLKNAKNYKTQLRSKADLDDTIKIIAKLDCKGVSLFREGLIDTYPTSYKEVKEGLLNG